MELLFACLEIPIQVIPRVICLHVLTWPRFILLFFESTSLSLTEFISAHIYQTKPVISFQDFLNWLQMINMQIMSA